MIKELYIETDVNYWFKLIKFTPNMVHVSLKTSNGYESNSKFNKDFISYLKTKHALW